MDACPPVDGCCGCLFRWFLCGRVPGLGADIYRGLRGAYLWTVCLGLAWMEGPDGDLPLLVSRETRSGVGRWCTAEPATQSFTSYAANTSEEIRGRRHRPARGSAPGVCWFVFSVLC